MNISCKLKEIFTPVELHEIALILLVMAMKINQISSNTNRRVSRTKKETPAWAVDRRRILKMCNFSSFTIPTIHHEPWLLTLNEPNSITFRWRMLHLSPKFCMNPFRLLTRSHLSCSMRSETNWQESKYSQHPTLDLTRHCWAHAKSAIGNFISSQFVIQSHINAASGFYLMRWKITGGKKRKDHNLDRNPSRCQVHKKETQASANVVIHITSSCLNSSPCMRPLWFSEWWEICHCQCWPQIKKNVSVSPHPPLPRRTNEFLSH